jgi:hypothetical protein
MKQYQQSYQAKRPSIWHPNHQENVTEAHMAIVVRRVPNWLREQLLTQLDSTKTVVSHMTIAARSGICI